MAKKILIDMILLRQAMIEDSSIILPEGLFYKTANDNGLKTIRELATFRITCRRCQDAPCIKACPADALEKDDCGIIARSTNLCISCKSCVAICPFGTMMGDFFKHHRNKNIYYDLTDTMELEKFINDCPDGTISIVDSEENHENHVYALNDNVLIRDYLYTTENQ